jgi:hypothetical protein
MFGPSHIIPAQDSSISSFHHPEISEQPFCGSPTPSFQGDSTNLKTSMMGGFQDDHTRILECINSNRVSLEPPLNMNDTTPRASSNLPSSLPPVTRHMSLYANRAAPRFKPYQLGGRFPTALENRFTAKFILPHNEGDINLIDVHQVY